MDTTTTPVAAFRSDLVAPLAWASEFALTGLVLGGLTPLAGQVWVPLDLRSYAAVTAVIGLGVGAATGGGLRAVLGAFPERTRAAIALLGGPVVCGAWGGLTAGLGAVIEQPGYLWLAFPCGAVAGMAHGSWFAPLSAFLESRGLPRWPLAVLSGGLSPVLATVGVFAVLAVFHGLR